MTGTAGKFLAMIHGAAQAQAGCPTQKSQIFYHYCFMIHLDPALCEVLLQGSACATATQAEVMQNARRKRSTLYLAKRVALPINSCV